MRMSSAVRWVGICIPVVRVSQHPSARSAFPSHRSPALRFTQSSSRAPATVISGMPGYWGWIRTTTIITGFLGILGDGSRSWIPLDPSILGLG